MMRAFILMFLPMVAIGAERVACPAVLPAEAITVRAPAGWTSVTTSFTRLTGAGMMAGPPESMAELKPDTRDRMNPRWTFAPEYEKWMTCGYGSALQISKRLDDSTTACTVRYVKSEHGGIESATATCKDGKR